MRAAKVDANHAEVVAALRAIGASVADTSRAGQGYPDITVGFRGRNWMIEIKDGSKPPSARKLTPAQLEFVAAWRGQYAVVTSAQQAIDIVSA
jgi:hypothetical protein